MSNENTISQKQAEELARKSAKLTQQAIEAYENFDTEKSLALAGKALKVGALSATASIKLIGLFNLLDVPEQAEILAETTRNQINHAVETAGDDKELLLDWGLASMELKDFERAEAILSRVEELYPGDPQAPMLMIHVHLRKGNPDKVITYWNEFIKNSEDADRFSHFIAKALGHYGYTEEAIAFFSEKKCYFQKDVAGFEEALAALRGTSGQLSQRDMATRLFDNFAEDYDRNLKALGNSGPQMIGATLVKLDLPRNGHLEFLDAGCGTGLCAPFLRPFASQIHGCDVSIPMLEQCKQKKVYDHLTRTDLGVLSTFPNQKFDVVVSGDVLVYFGDLLPILQNFKEVLKPGGMLIITVEDCSENEPAKGYELRTSGRHAHGINYLTRALVTAGFSKPKAEIVSELRSEFRTPVIGRAIAAQRLATF